jgi:hypothetical protein
MWYHFLSTNDNRIKIIVIMLANLFKIAAQGRYFFNLVRTQKKFRASQVLDMSASIRRHLRVPSLTYIIFVVKILILNHIINLNYLLFRNWRLTSDLLTRSSARPDWKRRNCWPWPQNSYSDPSIWIKNLLRTFSNKKWFKTICGFSNLYCCWKIMMLTKF